MPVDDLSQAIAPMWASPDLRDAAFEAKQALYAAMRLISAAERDDEASRQSLVDCARNLYTALKMRET